MNEHLTEQSVDAYLRDALPDAARQGAEAHLAGCAACRDLVARERRYNAAYRSLRALTAAPASPALLEHLLPEQVAAYVHGDLDPIDRELAESHFADCALCRAEQRDLRASQAMETQTSSEPIPSGAGRGSAPAWPRFALTSLVSAAGAAALILALEPRLFPGRFANANTDRLAQQVKTLQQSNDSLAAHLAGRQARDAQQIADLTRQNGERQKQMQASAQQAQSAQRTAMQARAAQAIAERRAQSVQRERDSARLALNAARQGTENGGHSASEAAESGLRDGGARIALTKQGAIRRTEAVPLPRAVADALAQAKLSIPRQQIALLTRRDDFSLRDPHAPKPGFSVLTPGGIISLSDRPRFAWTPLAKATRYEAALEDAAGNLVESSGRRVETSWTPAKPLARGRTYQWHVEAYDGDDLLEAAPKPPLPPAQFAVLDQSRAEEIAHARRDYADSPLTLGVLYARAGLLAEAEDALKQVAAANPGSLLARKLLNEIRAARKPASPAPSSPTP